MKKSSGGKKVEKEGRKKSLILVTFHHTKTSDLLGVKSGFKKRERAAEKMERVGRSRREVNGLSDNPCLSLIMRGKNGNKCLERG